MLIVFAHSNEHLRELIAQEMDKQGPQANLNHIDIRRVKNLDGIFKDSPFNGDISKWEFGFVTSAQHMFENSAFNGDISQWNASVLEKADSMFKDSQFTGDISQWDTRRLTQAYHMFAGSAFNGDISNWNMASLESSRSMFEGSKFNGDISRWNMAKVHDMSSMFKDSAFKGDISQWNVGQVRSMEFMFENSVFNGALSDWNVEQVATTRNMFKDSLFNQDISRWKLRAVRDMGRMFQGSAFNQPIASWDFTTMGAAWQAKSWRLESYNANKHQREQVEQDATVIELLDGDYDEPGYDRPRNSCLAMFKDSAFSQDMSMSNMPFDARIEDLFSGNPQGLAAQGVSPWLLRLHLEQGTSPADSQWREKIDKLREQNPDIQPFAGACALSMWRQAHGLPVPARQPEQPKTLWELTNLVNKELLEQGPSAHLNHIDVSQMVSLRGLFKGKKFTGDISAWDVSGVYDMRSLFENCSFNGDISKWDVSKVGQMDKMFKGSPFTGDISRWDVSNVSTMVSMFEGSAFNNDIGSWTFKKLVGCARMFADSAFDKDISGWALPVTFASPGSMAHYDARMCGITTNPQYAQFWTTIEGRKIWREREYWIDDNKADLNANEMFAGAAFKHDISSWNLLATPNAGMFKDNDAGLAAQKLSPSLLRYLLDENKPLPDPTLDQLWSPLRSIVCSLLPSSQEQAKEFWTMLQHEIAKVHEKPAVDIHDFDGFLAPVEQP